MIKDKQLLTFVVFAYNQERFIAEAVQGALSQTYSPLEIILSDDCSSDRTFEIMQEIAKTYAGPNRVIVRRNEENLGLIGHINRVMEIVQGELIVVGAGDDISLSKRVEEIYRVYLSSNKRALSVYSNAFLTQGTDSKNVLVYGEPPSPRTHEIEYLAIQKRCVLGSSHAWHRDVFNVFGPLDANGVFEDVVIPFRSALLGEIRYIHEPLIFYRNHENNLYNRNVKITVLSYYRNQRRNLSLYITAFKNRLRDLEVSSDNNLIERRMQIQLRSLVSKTIDDFEMELDFLSSSFIKRCLIIIKALKQGTPAFRVRDWISILLFLRGKLFVSNLYVTLRVIPFFARLLDIKRAFTKSLRLLKNKV